MYLDYVAARQICDPSDLSVSNFNKVKKKIWFPGSTIQYPLTASPALSRPLRVGRLIYLALATLTAVAMTYAAMATEVRTPDPVIRVEAGSGPALASDPVLEVVAFGMTRRGHPGRPAIAPRPNDYIYPAPGPGDGGSHLYHAADKIGLPDSMIDQIVALFSGQINFHEVLQFGYKCTVLYEMNFEEGRITGPGAILAVKLSTQERDYTAYRARSADGVMRYYDTEAIALEKTFLKSPIQFSRTSSEFAIRRFHPILNLWRAHNGIDYAAPRGTPVLASGNGEVEFIGSRGDYGNLVIIKHASGLSSWYGHLDSFAPGLTRGKRVKQGDILGLVGMTGLATGPHLHYEVRQNDQPIDPAEAAIVHERLEIRTEARVEMVPNPDFPTIKAANDKLLNANVRAHLLLQ